MTLICTQIRILNTRTSIESSYGRQVGELKMQYTIADNELLKEFLDARRDFELKSETLITKTNLDLKEDSFCKHDKHTVSHSLFLVFTLNFQFTLADTLPLRTFSKNLDDKQLALWLANHPELKRAEYQHDIYRLKGMLIIVQKFYNNYS